MKPEDGLREVDRRYADVKAERVQAIRDAAAAGMTRRAIAAVLGISHQRVQQIIRGE